MPDMLKGKSHSSLTRVIENQTGWCVACLDSDTLDLSISLGRINHLLVQCTSTQGDSTIFCSIQEDPFHF